MSSFLSFLSQMGRAKGQLPDDYTPGNSSGKSAFYPQDLFTPGNDAYILFLRRDPTNKNAPSTDDKTAIRLALYMPAQIAVNYGAQWEDIQLTLQQWTDLGSDLKTIYEELNTGGAKGRNIAGGLALDLGARGISKAIDFTAVGANTLQQYEQYVKKTRNPHMALLFKGVDFRQFQFNFQLMARNKDESNSIRAIIEGFKAGMHPNVEQAEGRFWIYPDSFDIYLCSGPQQDASQYLFQISNSVLTNMSVDYAGSGIPSFFHQNGAPVDIRMTLQFKEQEVLTRERIIQGY